MIALYMVTWAVYGVIGLVALLLSSVVVVPLLYGPSLVYFGLLIYPPVVLTDLSLSWVRRAGKLVVVFICGLFLVLILDGMTVWLIAWIADRDPCASWSAGVTGTIPPVNCSSGQK